MSDLEIVDWRIEPIENQTMGLGWVWVKGNHLEISQVPLPSGGTKEIGITRLITSTHTGQLETEWQLYGRWGDVNELIGHFIADNNSTH